jgi:hypothetical protein
MNVAAPLAAIGRAVATPKNEMVLAISDPCECCGRSVRRGLGEAVRLRGDPLCGSNSGWLTRASVRSELRCPSKERTDLHQEAGPLIRDLLPPLFRDLLPQ